MTSNNYNNFSLPIKSYFNNVSDFEPDLQPVDTFRTRTQADLVKTASARILFAIDPALISKDRAGGSTNGLYRLACNIYYIARKFFVSSTFLKAAVNLHDQSKAFIKAANKRQAAVIPAPTAHSDRRTGHNSRPIATAEPAAKAPNRRFSEKDLPKATAYSKQQSRSLPKATVLGGLFKTAHR